MEIVLLASQSPRRRDLLASAGLELRQRTVNVDESLRRGESPRQYVQRLALEKVRHAVGDGDVWAEIAAVVGADTVVCVDESVLGKPADRGHAAEMLAQLAGRSHWVYTGWTVMNRRGSASGVGRTKVTFRPLAAHEIDLYIDTGEPFDKAGAYGIQGRGGSLVDTIEGSYTNVVGLPLKEVLAAIAALRDESKILS